MRATVQVCSTLCKRSSRPALSEKRIGPKTGFIDYQSWHEHSSTTTAALHKSDKGSTDLNEAIPEDAEGGAMSRRLEQLTDEALESGGRSAQKAVGEAGFDEALRKRLEEKIASANIQSEYPSAFAQVGMPSSAGKGTKDIAGAQPWTGVESVEDAALRMLTDAHKPLSQRPGGRSSSSPRTPAPRVAVSPGPIRRTNASAGARIANAKERSSVYISTKELSQDEQEQFRNELKARFTPFANNLPATLQGISSLANQKIEDAIARGQFKNLPRGKAVEVDYHANSPFIDTTEYIMNKMMKKQDIKHEWIERQQEIDTAVRRFRSRLRGDWKRHAARLMSSKGGSLDDKIRRAEKYAEAERVYQAHTRATWQSNSKSMENGDHMSQTSLSGELTPTSLETATQGAGTTGVIEASDHDQGLQIPFRDADWEAAEKQYHELNIKSLNDSVRSYNLIAPQPSKRVYFNLKRELNACYADAAPLIGEEIRQRALHPTATFKVAAPSSGSIPFLDSLDRSPARVHDENLEVKGYGIKEFWKDIWKK